MIRPDPGPARDWVRQELTGREYQPSLLERLAGWFNDLIDKLTGAVDNVGRLQPAVAAVVVVLLLIGLAVVLARLRPDPSARQRRPGAVLPQVRLSASEHRRRAESAAADGRYDDAVVEAMRALATGLVERAVLDDLPGATAREVTDRAARSFAALAGRLDAAATLFDAVRYGDRHADRAAAADLLALEEDLRRERPAAAAPGSPVAAVPR